MLADIDLKDRLVIIAGAGDQAYKRAKSLLAEGCRIVVMGAEVDARFAGLDGGRIETRQEKIAGAEFVRGCGARIVIAATDDSDLNAAILEAARAEPNCLAYTPDAEPPSDYSNVASARLSDSVELAVSTRGASPIMARAICDRAAESLAGLVTPADEAQIRLQAELRAEAKGRIAAPADRRRFLRGIAEDPAVKQLIKDGKTDAAKERAMSVLDGWNNA